MKNMIRDAAILFAITLIAGFVLGFVYNVTKEPIAQAEEKAAKEAYAEVFQDASDFNELAIEEDSAYISEWEEAGFAETLDHDHHTGDEEDGRPVDAGACALRGAVPEVGAEDGAEVQGVFDRVPAVHADAEHDHEHEGRTAERDILALEFVHDDERKHADKDDGRKNLSSHRKNLLS